MNNYVINQIYNPQTENRCYICLDNSGTLIKPCLCRGTNGGVHRHCLIEWINQSEKNYCTVCNYDFKYEILCKPSCKRLIDKHYKCNSCNNQSDEVTDYNVIFVCSL